MSFETEVLSGPFSFRSELRVQLERLEVDLRLDLAARAFERLLQRRQADRA